MSEHANASTGQLVADLSRAGIRVWAQDGQLRFRAPAGAMTEQRRALLRSRKAEILDHLAAAGLPALVADPDHRYEPFPITDVQSAYLLGRGRTFAYGGVACHGYGELRYPDLDPDRMTAAWRALIARHDMLRAVVEVDGSQRVLPEVPDYTVAVTDARQGDLDAAVAANRSEMDHRVFDPAAWPLFEARISRGDTAAVLHVSVDFLIADFVSIQILLRELHHLYHRPLQPLPPLEVTFRDYLAAERRHVAQRRDADRVYWLDRVDELPAGPDLPLRGTAERSTGRFSRLAGGLDAEAWQRLRKLAGQYDISPSGAVLAAYAHTVAAWSRRPAFTLNVTLLNRLPLHPRVPGVIGDFTGVELLEVRSGRDDSFAGFARAVQARLWQDMDHRAFSGVEVIREITRRRGAEAALFPVVFTSAIGLADGGQAAAGGEAMAGPSGELGYGISQTPQVIIDCQNAERDGALATNWDVRAEVLPAGVAEDMFAAFEALLHQLASDEQAWQRPPPVELPAGQRERRDRVNATAGPRPAGRLHDAFFALARTRPDAPAVWHEGRSVSYGELAAAAAGVADRLKAAGCGHAALVGITLERGAGQVAAVLGTLLAGAAYVPVDTGQPPARRDEILTNAGVRLVLTDADRCARPWPAGVSPIAADRIAPVEPGEITGAEPKDLAYVIHTSGSTGVPKGVMITHEAALNTVEDINRRFAVTAADRVIGLSQLGFDLSVYDVFGPLSVGGALVVPGPQRRADPSHWAELVAAGGVTVWNSVPAQLQMLSDYLAAVPDPPDLTGLRLAMLSGDWIPVALPDRIRAQVPGLAVVSLGGATEASIWSICYPIDAVDPGWAAIPYGRPLANQSFHVLDAAMRDCPDWVTGELYIGGAGVAAGYLNDPQRTAERFVTHPRTGERLYRTGDLGRYRADGEIEFLGREDQQVKIRGHRIELAEVETALRAHPRVAAAAVLVDGDRPLERRLAGFARPATVPPPDDTALLSAASAAANRAGDAAVAGVDPAAYRAYADLLDRVALPAMLDTLRQGGLFAGPGDRHTFAEIATVAAPRHHRLLRRWLRALLTEGLLTATADDTYALVAAPEPDAVRSAWAAVDAAALPGEAKLLDYFRRSIAHLPALLRGQDDPLDLLFPDGRLEVSQQLYEDALFNRWANAAAGAVAAHLAADLPVDRPVRVLEVGAGGGGTTAAVLAALSGRPLDYLCTDLSPYFTSQARTRFADVPGLRLQTYDLDAPAAAQGLPPNAFDLVIAGDVLHATIDVDRVLAELRGLTAPGGWLIALEMTRDHYQIMTSLELLVRLDAQTGDFSDERRGTDLVFLGRDRWLAALRRAGAGTALCLPAADTFVGELGMCVLAARLKPDRARLDTADLTAHLRDRLPEYMVPSVLQIIDEIPMTGNAKVDRRALAARLPRHAAAGPGPGAGAAPRTELEKRLAAMWGEALGVPVARDGNLFELGGDSLVAAQLAGRMIEDLPEASALFFDEVLRNLLERATVAGVADWLGTAAVPETGGAAADTVAEAPADLLVRLPVDGPGVPRLFLPDPAGELAAASELATLLSPAPGWGLDAAGLRRLPAVDRVAAGYAQAVIDADLAQVEVYGTGPMAGLAVALARVLTERGVLVERVVLVAGLRPATGVPEIYAGNLLLVQPTDPDPASLACWEDICLGDLEVREAGCATAGLTPAAVAGALTR